MRNDGSRRTDEPDLRKARPGDDRAVADRLDEARHDRRFWRVTSVGALKKAERRVRSNIVSNGGRLPPAADLPALSHHLRSGSWVRGIARYEQSDKGRWIARLSYEDRIVDRAVATSITRSADPHLPDSVHGFRPRRGPHTLIDGLRDLVADAVGGHVVKVDIRHFFDEVSHVAVLSGLSAIGVSGNVLAYVEDFLDAHAQQRNPGSAKGMPQGSPLSPVLANVALLPVMRRLQEAQKRPGDEAPVETQVWDEAKAWIKRRRPSRRGRAQLAPPTTGRLPEAGSPRLLSLPPARWLHNRSAASGAQTVPAPSTMMVGALLYGDDLLLVIAGGRDQGARMMRFVQSELSALGLEASSDKSGVYSIHDPWTILGLVCTVDSVGVLTATPRRSRRHKLRRLLTRVIAGIKEGEAVDDPDGRLIGALMPRTSHYASLGADLGFLDISGLLSAAGVQPETAAQVEDHLLLRRPLRTSRRDGWSTDETRLHGDDDA